MRPARFQPSSSDPQREALRRRVTAIVLTILAHALLLLMLLRLAPEQFHLPGEKRLTTFSLMPEAEPAAKQATTTDRSNRRSGGVPHQPPPPRPVQEVKVPPPPEPTPPLNILALNRQEMASADISHLRSDRGERDSGQGETVGTGAGPDKGEAYGPHLGGGGGGHQLFNAEWYREPTDAELTFYMPKTGTHIGYAMIACQTVERFHVDNCEILGDTPGSGFGRAMQQAAWQFLVRPPRVDGRTMVGAWVRIRIDFTERGITK